jgi:hypothetical protein
MPATIARAFKVAPVVAGGAAQAIRAWIVTSASSNSTSCQIWEAAASGRREGPRHVCVIPEPRRRLHAKSRGSTTTMTEATGHRADIDAGADEFGAVVDAAGYRFRLRRTSERSDGSLRPGCMAGRDLPRTRTRTLSHLHVGQGRGRCAASDGLDLPVERVFARRALTLAPRVACSSNSPEATACRISEATEI